MGTDGGYFLSRAEEEERHASTAHGEDARNAHLRLAKVYRDRAAMSGPQPLLDDGPRRPILTIR